MTRTMIDNLISNKNTNPKPKSTLNKISPSYNNNLISKGNHKALARERNRLYRSETLSRTTFSVLASSL